MREKGNEYLFSNDYKYKGFGRGSEPSLRIIPPILSIFLVVEKDEADTILRDNAVKGNEKRTQTQDSASEMEEGPTAQEGLDIRIVALVILHAVALSSDGVVLADGEELLGGGVEGNERVRDDRGDGDGTIEVRDVLGLVVQSSRSSDTSSNQAQVQVYSWSQVRIRIRLHVARALIGCA